MALKDGVSTASEAASHQLELVQHIMVTSASFASRNGAISLLSGPHCQNFAVYGPLRVSLYSPQVPAKRALRLVRKGDMARALQLLQAEILSPRQQPDSHQWLQRVVGLSVAQCLRQVCDGIPRHAKIFDNTRPIEVYPANRWPVLFLTTLASTFHVPSVQQHVNLQTHIYSSTQFWQMIDVMLH